MRAGGQDEGEGLQRVIGVLHDAAAHAAGVVGEDAADAAACDGGRVGTDLAAIELERVVGLLSDDSGLEADGLAVFLDAHAAPVAADIDEDAVSDGLTREAGASGAEAERDAVLVAETEEMRDFFGGLGLDDGARDEAVEAGVGGEGDAVDGADEDTGGIDAVAQMLADSLGTGQARV